MDMTTETPPHPDWKHRWIHAGNGWDAFAIWQDAKWPETEEEQRAMYLEYVGEFPDGSKPVDVACYCADPELERLRAMKTPTVCLLPEDWKPF